MPSSTIVSQFTLDQSVSTLAAGKPITGRVIGITLNRYNVIRILIECLDTAGRPFEVERAENKVTAL